MTEKKRVDVVESESLKHKRVGMDGGLMMDVSSNLSSGSALHYNKGKRERKEILKGIDADVEKFMSDFAK